MYVLSDYKAEIDIIYNRHQTDQQAHVLTRVRSYLKTLHALRIEITLVWIPGHCDIHFHDLADSCAKDSIKNAYDIPTATYMQKDDIQTVRSIMANKMESVYSWKSYI